MATSKKNTPQITVKNIEVKTWKGSQSVHFRKLIQLNDYKVKIEIKRDSHQPQSTAVASVFNMEKLEWCPVYTIPAPMLKINESWIYGQNVLTAAPFAFDAETLMAGIISILF